VIDFLFRFTLAYIVSFVTLCADERTVFHIFVFAVGSKVVEVLWRSFKSWRVRMTIRDEEALIGLVGEDDMSGKGVDLYAVRLGEDESFQAGQ
jgi:hypothetical protein